MAQRSEPRQDVKQHINWIAAGAIGLVALGFGLYLLIDTDNATQLIGAIIAFALLLASLVHLLRGFQRNVHEFVARAALLSGGVGVTVGAIVTLDLGYDFLTEPAARLILAGGLIVYGLLGLAGLAVDRKDPHLLRTILASVVALVFAALLIYDSQSAELQSGWFAAGLIIVGLILIGLAAYTHRRRDAAFRSTSPSSGRSAGADSGPRLRIPGRDRKNEARSEGPDAAVPPAAGPASPGRASESASRPRPAETTRPTTARVARIEGASDTRGESASEPIAAGPPRTARPAPEAAGASTDDHNFDPFTGERVRPPTNAGTTRTADPDTTAGRGPFTPQRP